MARIDSLCLVKHAGDPHCVEEFSVCSHDNIVGEAETGSADDKSVLTKLKSTNGTECDTLSHCERAKLAIDREMRHGGNVLRHFHCFGERCLRVTFNIQDTHFGLVRDAVHHIGARIVTNGTGCARAFPNTRNYLPNAAFFGSPSAAFLGGPAIAWFMAGGLARMIPNNAIPNNATLLTDLGLANQLSDTDLAALARLAVLLNVEAGETIFREGERHPFAYWVVKGQVSLEMASSGNMMQSLLTLADGDLLAWSDLLARRRMTAAARTLQPTLLLQFETNALLKLCEQNHEIGYRLMQHIAGQLAQRLVATRLQMLDLFQHPVESPGEVQP